MNHETSRDSTIINNLRHKYDRFSQKLSAKMRSRIDEWLAYPFLQDINVKYAEYMHYPQADRLTTQILWLHGAALVILVMINSYLQAPLLLPSPFGWRVISLSEGLVVMVLGLLAALLPIFAYRRLQNHFLWRLLVAVCLITFSYLFVYISGGAIEMHFHFFVAMAYMSIYADWRIGWLILGVIFVGHSILSLLFPNWLYFYGRNDLSLLLYMAFTFLMALFTTIYSRNYRGSVAALDLAKNRNDEFLAIASHELKTPLTSVKGYTEVLQRKFKRQSDASALEYVDKIEDQLNRIIGLVRDLLDISRIRSGQVQFRNEMVSIESLVNTAVDAVDAYSQHHDILVTGDKRVMVCGDRVRLSQLLVNLLTNAIKYSPEADKVLVEIKAARDRVVVEVRDFGIGISLEEKEKIFQPYFRGRAEQREDVPGGLGMGLYICDEIIRHHNGRLWVESVVGEGSTFSFMLPLPKPGEECK